MEEIPERPPMHIQRAAKPFEWNLNTLVSLVGFALTIMAGGYFLNDLNRNDAATLEWQSRHERAHADRRAEVETDIGRLQAVTIALDDRLDTTEAATARLSDRISATEARSVEMAGALRELQAAINAQSGDLKVILAWIEEQRRRSAARP